MRISRGWCTCCGRRGAWVGELVRWFRGPAFVCACGPKVLPARGLWRSCCEGRPRPGALPPPAALLVGAVGARCPRAVGTGVRVRVRCEGRLLSGAPPPPTLRPLGGLSGSVIHSCCGRGCAGGGARRCPLGLHALWGPPSAGLAGPVPGGVARHRCEGRLVSGAVPAPVARPLGGPSGSTTHMLWARACGCGGPAPSLRPACPVGAPCRGGGGGRPQGGGLPPLRAASGVRRCPSPSCPPSGAGSRVFRDPCVPGAVVAGVGTQHRPHSVRPCGPASLAVGLAEGRPRGGAFHCCEGHLTSGAPPPPTVRPLGGLLGSTTHVLWARACGCGGPTLSPWPACPVGAACRGGGRGPSLGAMACHRCEGHLVSGAVPPPAARPLGWAAGVLLKQVTTLPWHFTPKGALFGPIYGIYVG